MKLGSKARYAVMAMAELAALSRKDELTPVSLTVIAEQQHLPLPYLEQLFLKLKKAHLVQSHRGASGGYLLSKPLNAIYILDIVTAVDHSLKATRCDSHKTGCQPNGDRCITHDLWAELDTVVETFLSKITLLHVIDGTLHGLGRFGFMCHTTDFQKKVHIA
jgi:Rrf2 family transcriptional regulator, iron-sulfur cluster assembly transcription factor